MKGISQRSFSEQPPGPQNNFFKWVKPTSQLGKKAFMLFLFPKLGQVRGARVYMIQSLPSQYGPANGGETKPTLETEKN